MNFLHLKHDSLCFKSKNTHRSFQGFSKEQIFKSQPRQCLTGKCIGVFGLGMLKDINVNIQNSVKPKQDKCKGNHTKIERKS